MTRDTGYPKMISKGFAGVPNNVDAAFVWSGNGKIYFFKVSWHSSFFVAWRMLGKESRTGAAKDGKVTGT